MGDIVSVRLKDEIRNPPVWIPASEVKVQPLIAKYCDVYYTDRVYVESIIVVIPQFRVTFFFDKSMDKKTIEKIKSELKKFAEEFDYEFNVHCTEDYCEIIGDDTANSIIDYSIIHSQFIDKFHKQLNKLIEEINKLIDVERI